MLKEMMPVNEALAWVRKWRKKHFTKTLGVKDKALITLASAYQKRSTRFLSVLLFQEDGYDNWVAQCLEHDFATQGKTKQEALDALERTILGQIHLDTQDGIEPLSEIKPPPPITEQHLIFTATRLAEKEILKTLK